MEWRTYNILFTQTKLNRLILQFLYPYTDKLLQLLKRSQLHETDEHINQILGENGKADNKGKELSMRPFRFYACSPPNNLLSNHEKAMDLIFIGNDRILQTVVTQTEFQTVTVLGENIPDDL